MKVFSKKTGWRAAKRGYVDGRPAMFRAFPPRKNVINNEKSFDTEYQLANFLIQNPNWKSYFKSDDGQKNGQHLAVVQP